MSDSISDTYFNGDEWQWINVVDVAKKKSKLHLSDDIWQGIKNTRLVVESIANSGIPHYGINTGLGALCHVALDSSQLQKLSWHTLMSHAAGVGEPLKTEQVRAIMCCAVINFSHGCSGVNPSVVKRLIYLLNNDITPVVPSAGSVGYLSHMAHIGLSLIGQGEVNHEGDTLPTEEVYFQRGIEPVQLGAKDGLCIVNGTVAMTGLACLELDAVTQLADWADIVSAMSVEALSGQLTAFDASVLGKKKHNGMQITGRNVRSLLEGSGVVSANLGRHLQDALSVRSIPQVHGACRDQLSVAAQQIQNELNSVSDNPIVIYDNDNYRVVSQANPHGESVAMACDMLSIAVSEWGAISERRVFRLLTPHTSYLPAFLTPESGVKSGLMIAQYSAASLACDTKKLAQPCVIENYLTSGMQEDHLSFGETSALQLHRAVSNVFYILAIEYLSASQAFDLIEDKPFGNGTGVAWCQLRNKVKFYEENHPIAIDIQQAYDLMRQSDSLDCFELFIRK